MSLIDIEELMPEVMKFARNAPEPSIIKELRDAVRRFCSATKCWRDEDSFTVVAPGYEGLLSTADTSIVAIEAAELDGRKLYPITIVDLDRLYSGWRRDTDEGSARYITQLSPNSLTIYPRQTGTLQVGLVLQPSRDALTMPDFIADQFGKEIGRGAAGELLVVPNTDYTDKAVGAALMAEFTSFVARKKLTIAKGQMGAPLRTKGNFL